MEVVGDTDSSTRPPPAKAIPTTHLIPNHLTEGFESLWELFINLKTRLVIFILVF